MPATKKATTIYSLQAAIDILEKKIVIDQEFGETNWKLIGRKKKLIKQLASMHEAIEKEREVTQ